MNPKNKQQNRSAFAARELSEDEGEDENSQSEEEQKQPARRVKSEEEEDAMSDYIDENFELDETDEYWGIGKLPCHEL